MTEQNEMIQKVENWNGNEIRFISNDGKEWQAIAKDVADALDYSETAQMTRHLDGKYFMSVKLTGMNMKSTVLTEKGI